MKHITYTYKDFISILLIVLSFALGFYFYAHFPDQVATHWDMQGNINGYSSRTIAAFVFPCIMLIVYIMLSLLPYIDPRKERYDEFKRPYSIFKLVMMIFLILMNGAIGLNGLGYPIDISSILPVLVGLLFICIGNYLGKIKPNWFIGIRTPWTISNEEVWNKTHRLGGKLFVIGGIILVLSAFLPVVIKMLFFVPVIIIVALVPIVYSYIIYKQIQK